MFCHYAECRYAEFRILFIIMLNVIMLSVVMLIVVEPVEVAGSDQHAASITAVKSFKLPAQGLN